MGGDRRARHRYKELFYSLEQELRSDYGLSVIESRALVRRLAEFIDQIYEDEEALRGPGQVRYVAVAEGQPAGRPLSHCVTVPVLLTVLGETDAELMHDKGSVTLRRARIQRLTHQARRQGALLSYEDLSLILAVDISTIRRHVSHVKKGGLEIPTRGRIADIGPGTSHRARVIELLFRGLQPGAISAYTSHSIGNVERYIADFARVVELVHRKYPSSAIVRITALSPKTVRNYCTLAEQYSGPQHQPVMQMLRQRFGSLTNSKEESWEAIKEHPDKPPMDPSST